MCLFPFYDCARVCVSSSSQLLTKTATRVCLERKFWDVSARCCGYMLARQILWVNMLKNLLKKFVLFLSDSFKLHHIHCVEAWGFVFSCIFLFLLHRTQTGSRKILPQTPVLLCDSKTIKITHSPLLFPSFLPLCPQCSILGLPILWTYAVAMTPLRKMCWLARGLQESNGYGTVSRVTRRAHTCGTLGNDVCLHCTEQDLMRPVMRRRQCVIAVMWNSATSILLPFG